MKGILAWRSSLTESERQRLNHPSSVLRRWKKDTEPLEERRAARIERMTGPKESPFLGALADAEGERDDARQHATSTANFDEIARNYGRAALWSRLNGSADSYSEAIDQLVAGVLELVDEICRSQSLLTGAPASITVAARMGA